MPVAYLTLALINKLTDRFTVRPVKTPTRKEPSKAFLGVLHLFAAGALISGWAIVIALVIRIL
jgi:hypothetical protein